MEVVSNSFMPGDPCLIDHIVYELKSQGIFDNFRKECIADVDTKPAYQNLRQRVEGSVSGFLKTQKWRKDMNKNHVREMLRKNISESGFLETGVERIVDQVVNPKINSIFLPQVENIIYKVLGIQKPANFDDLLTPTIETNNSNNISNSNNEDLVNNALLPHDLEAVSPDSETHEKKLNISNESQKLEDSKMEEDESPPFEPLDEPISLGANEENSIDSNLSGFSGLVSHESNHSVDTSAKETSTNMSIQNSPHISKQSLDDHFSNSMGDDTELKMDISEDSNYSMSNSKICDSTDATQDVPSTFENKIQNILTSESNDSSVKLEEKIKMDDKNNDKHHSSHKHRSRHDSRTDSKDKDKKSDRDKKDHRNKSTSSKDRDKKDRDRKDSRSKSGKDDKEKQDRDKNKNSNKHSSRDDKEKNYLKKRSSSESKLKESTNNKESKSVAEIQEERSQSKDFKDKEKNESTKNKDASKSKTEGRSHSSNSRSRSDSKSHGKHNGKSKSSSSDMSKKKDDKPNKKDDKYGSSKEKQSSTSKKDEKNDKERKDGKRSNKKEVKDDHYSIKGKRFNRRSTDRDSSDGHSGTHSSSSSSFTDLSLASQLQQSSQATSAVNSNSASGESGNSDEVEGTESYSYEKTASENDVDNSTVVTTIQIPQVKIIKPKFASNIYEARRLMKIRRKLGKLEKSTKMELLDDNLINSNFIQDVNLQDYKVSEAQNTDEVEGSERISNDSFINLRTQEDNIHHENKENIKIKSKNAVRSQSKTQYQQNDEVDISELDLELSQNAVVSKESWDRIEARLNSEPAQSDASMWEKINDSELENVSNSSIRDVESCEGLPKELFQETKKKMDILFNVINNLQDEIERKRQLLKLPPSRENKNTKSSNVCDTLRKLPKVAVVDCIIDNEIYISPTKGIKRLASESMELHNNNNKTHNQFKQNSLVKTINHVANKVDELVKNSTQKLKKAKLMDSSVSHLDSFSLPLSPADSDKSFNTTGDKKTEKLLDSKSKKIRAINNSRNQRYSSDDLYKPRLQFTSTRRRGTRNPDVK